jgi:hypothetical protein
VRDQTGQPGDSAVCVCQRGGGMGAAGLFEVAQ